ncbi:MAG: Fe-S cluster domain-containing protein [Candidatus Eisenbacteria bacterium]|nr:Fe-S cluster domain-containing protein [Candidatus Eisenbacteria bacterium]
MESVVLKSVIALTALAAAFGAVLAVASRIFAVYRDPRVGQILECLPNANCGGCGFPGCQAYAEAAVARGEPPAACPPGGEEVARKVAEILGADVGEHVRKVAVVHCKGGRSTSVQSIDYEGIRDCRAAILVGGHPKACVFGCLGLGTCAAVCPFDAIELDDEGVVQVDIEKCTGCGKCVEACPVNIIELVPVDMKVHIRCSSHDKGKKAKSVCDVACIGCQMCVKKCPSEAIHMEDNLAVIDYEKCTNCGVCAAVCPTNAIIDDVQKRPVALIGSKCEGVGECAKVCPVKAISGEEGERHEVDREKCIGCGLCLDACPTRAITMVGALGLQKGRN